MQPLSDLLSNSYFSSIITFKLSFGKNTTKCEFLIGQSFNWLNAKQLKFNWSEISARIQ